MKEFTQHAAGTKSSTSSKHSDAPQVGSMGFPTVYQVSEAKSSSGRPAATHDQIAGRAYDIYVHSGSKQGRCEQNWRLAEQELAQEKRAKTADGEGASSRSGAGERYIHVVQTKNAGLPAPLAIPGREHELAGHLR